MTKSKRDKRRDRRAARSHASNAPTERASQRNGARGRGFNFWFVRIAPIVTAAAAIAVWLLAKSPQIAAIVGMGGAIVWLAVALSAVGSQVPPRDNVRSGAIDFGKRN